MRRFPAIQHCVVPGADPGAALCAAFCAALGATLCTGWSAARICAAQSASQAAPGWSEPPVLAERVKAGTLPPVEQRLPREPARVDTGGRIGRYGGRMRVISSQPNALSELSVVLPEPLLRFDPDGRTVVPNIARDWELSEDGRSITIHLRAGMRWSDGAPVTVDDVLFAYDDVLRNQDITPVLPARYVTGDVPMEVQRIDDHSFRMQFSEPYGAVTYFLTHARGAEALLMPKHWLRRYHPKYSPKAELDAMARERGFTRWPELFRDRNAIAKPEGVGPQTAPDYPTLSAWQVASVPSTGNVVLERNPYYWKVDREGNQLPYIDSILSTYAGQKKEATGIKLISGEVDLAGMEGGFDDAPLWLSHRERGGYRVFFWECNWGTRVACYLNQTHRDPVLRKIFQNRDFRIALSLGIDRKEINDVLYFGKCTPRQLTVNRVCSYFETEFAQAHAEYDPDRANRILDEIGLKRGHGGWRRRPDGKIVAISFLVLDGGFRPQTAELIRDYWEDLGVLVAIRAAEHSFWRTQLEANALDVVLIPDDVATDVMVLNSPVYGVQNWGWLWYRYIQTQGRTGEVPPAHVLELYETWRRMRSTIDVAERVELGKKLIRSQAENLWGIGTVGQNTRPIIVSNRLHNVPVEGLWGYPWLATVLHHPEQFYLDDDARAAP